MFSCHILVGCCLSVFLKIAMNDAPSSGNTLSSLEILLITSIGLDVCLRNCVQHFCNGFSALHDLITFFGPLSDVSLLNLHPEQLFVSA